jgi:transcriptional regulator with XRE-family HTH domain
MNEIKVKKVWLTEDAVWIETAEGKKACEKFADYSRLKWATQEELADYETDDFGIHWNQLDEDLSYEGFFSEHDNNRLYDIFVNHPELNASAIARRLHISQSLFAQYISGTKKPSAARLNEIVEEIKCIGKELAAV